MKGLLSAATGCLLLISCLHQAPSGRIEQTRRYPELFRAGHLAPHGLGFSRVYSHARDEAIDRAGEMALRSLSWSIHLRVAGERLFERTGDGELEFRGESIELLEVPQLALAECVVETLETDSHVWIAAHSEGHESPSLGVSLEFSAEPPGWVTEGRRDSDWIFASGSARSSHRDEPGAWEVAAYRAVVELAFSTGLAHRNLEKATEGYAAGASTDAVDARFNGVRVVGRWRDQVHVYVLVATPVPGRE